VNSPNDPTVLLEALESVSGLEVEIDAPLARHSTFRIGGPAQFLIRAHEESALEVLLSVTDRLGVSFELLGLGSNVLFPDEGLTGVVARLVGRFTEYEFQGDRVTAGGGLTLAKLARSASEKGLEGLEALSGFPSTVGGAVRMNAGSYGVEIKDVLVEAIVLERDGRRRRYAVEDLQASYRSTVLRCSQGVVASATFQLRGGSAEKATAKIEELNRRRWVALPSGRPNVGSIFRNPEGDYAGRLIEACELKGTARGDAQISPKHANVIVNNGGARASEVLDLMLLARRAVRDRFGVELVPEVELMGSLRERWRKAVDLEAQGRG
jgi:UDP-N-acetylmuramate dehydrogenase